MKNQDVRAKAGAAQGFTARQRRIGRQTFIRHALFGLRQYRPGQLRVHNRRFRLNWQLALS